MTNYTPEQINLFVDEHIRLAGEKMLMDANVAAVGASTGFSGNPKALEALERAVRGRVNATGMVGDLQQRLKRLANVSPGTKIRTPSSGAHGRRTSGPTRS